MTHSRDGQTGSLGPFTSVILESWAKVTAAQTSAALKSPSSKFQQFSVSPILMTTNSKMTNPQIERLLYFFLSFSIYFPFTLRVYLLISISYRDSQIFQQMPKFTIEIVRTFPMEPNCSLKMCRQAEEEDQESQHVLMESLWGTLVAPLQGTQVWTKTKQNTHYEQKAVVPAVLVRETPRRGDESAKIRGHPSKLFTLIPHSKWL